MTYDEIKKNKEVCECLKKGNENLGVLGFTDHSAAHCTMVAKRAAYILKKFGYSESDIEMVKIAGFMHDIGNVVNRSRHAEYGAILANEILKETDMSLKDRITVVSAIGHHDESTGGATDPISASAQGNPTRWSAPRTAGTWSASNTRSTIARSSLSRKRMKGLSPTSSR